MKDRWGKSGFAVARMVERSRRDELKTHRDRQEQGKERKWLFTNSPMSGEWSGAFETTFKHVLPQDYRNIKGGRGLEHYIADTIRANHRTGNAIALEVAGPGDLLFEDLRKQGLIARSIGICKGPFPDAANIPAADAYTLIDGDALINRTYVQLRSIIGPHEQIDVILERALGGLQVNHIMLTEFIEKVFGTWYGLLREGGVMFVQVPSYLDKTVEEWIARVHAQYSDTLEIESNDADTAGIDRGDADPTHALVMRLRKLSGAPATLPPLEIST